MQLILGSAGGNSSFRSFNSEHTVASLTILMLTAIYTPLDKICGPKKKGLRKKGGEENRKEFLPLTSAHKFKSGKNMDKEKQATRILLNSEKERKKMWS